jgi:hypothetical protein
MSMARGWESKAVEEQVIETTETAKAPVPNEKKSSAQQLREQAVKDLQLSRVRITNDLANATNPNHRISLEAALAYLNKKIAELS